MNVGEARPTCLKLQLSQLFSYGHLSRQVSAHNDAPIYAPNLVAKGLVFLPYVLFFDDLTLHCDLDLEDRNRTFLHDSLGHDDVPSYQVWLQTVQQFGRHLPDNCVTDGHTDNLIEEIYYYVSIYQYTYRTSQS